MDNITINVASNSIDSSSVAIINDSDLIRAIVESNDRIVQRLLDTIEKQSVLIESLKSKLSQQVKPQSYGER